MCNLPLFGTAGQGGVDVRGGSPALFGVNRGGRVSPTTTTH